MVVYKDIKLFVGIVLHAFFEIVVAVIPDAFVP